jgi:hypothetical protein
MNHSRQNSSKFSRKLPLIVSAVLKSRSSEDAAQVVGISTSTLKRWQRKPEFAQALAAAQAEIFSSVCNDVRRLGTDAASALGEVVKSTTVPASARTRAAGLIVSLLLRIHSFENQEHRLAAIERRLDAHARRGKESR